LIPFSRNEKVIALARALLALDLVFLVGSGFYGLSVCFWQDGHQTSLWTAFVEPILLSALRIKW